VIATHQCRQERRYITKNRTDSARTSSGGRGTGTNIDCFCGGQSCVDSERSSTNQSTSERDDGRTLSERRGA